MPRALVLLRFAVQYLLITRRRMASEPWLRKGDRRRALRGVLLGTGMLIGTLGLPSGADAQEIQEDVRHWCQDFWMLTREEILACLLRDYAAADAELNRVYQEKMRSLDATQRTRLRASQRAWLQRYDRVLTSYYSRPWANHSRVKVLPSQIKAVRDRTAYLRRVSG